MKAGDLQIPHVSESQDATVPESIHAQSLFHDAAYKQVFRSARSQGADGDLQASLRQLEDERSNGFSLERLQRLANQFPHNEYFKYIVSHFHGLDKDRSGRLTADELQPVIKQMGEKKLFELPNIRTTTGRDYVTAAKQYRTAIEELGVNYNPNIEALADIFGDIKRCLEEYPNELDKPVVENLPRDWGMAEDHTLLDKLSKAGLDLTEISRLGEFALFSGIDANLYDFSIWLTNPEWFKQYDSNSDGKISQSEFNAAFNAYLAQQGAG
jgi:hypothetical protein